MTLVARIQDLATAIGAWITKLRVRHIVIVVGDGVNDLTTGTKLTLFDLPAGTLVGWTLGANASGSVVVDLKKNTFALWPATTTITASSKPTLAAAQKNDAAALPGWTTTIAAGDAIDVVLDSVSGIKRITLVLKMKLA